MGFTIRRSTVINTDIKLESLDISKLKKELEEYGYLSEIDQFETESELYQLLREDEYTRLLIFKVLIDSNCYGQVHEWYSEHEQYSVELIFK